MLLCRRHYALVYVEPRETAARFFADFQLSVRGVPQIDARDFRHELQYFIKRRFSADTFFDHVMVIDQFSYVFRQFFAIRHIDAAGKKHGKGMAAVFFVYFKRRAYLFFHKVEIARFFVLRSEIERVFRSDKDVMRRFSYGVAQLIREFLPHL